MLDYPDPSRRRSVALGLYRMLTGPRFSVSVVREPTGRRSQALGAAALTAPPDRLAALRLHRCAAFAEMSPGFHAKLAAATLALFTGRPVLGDGFLEDLAAAAGLRPDEVVWEGGAVARASEGHRGKEREAGEAPASAMQRDAAPGSPQPSAARAPSSQTTSSAPAIQALVPVAAA